MRTSRVQVEHAAAEFIWRTKPAAVAVETAFTAEHGARTGGVLAMGDHMQRAADFRLRTLSQIAAQLDTRKLPEDSEIWQVHMCRLKLCIAQSVYMKYYCSWIDGLAQVTSLCWTAANPAKLSLQDLKEHLPGEQLVYVAAFAVGADLVYADRPKEATFQRLYNIPSLAGTTLHFWMTAAPTCHWLVWLQVPSLDPDP